MKQIVFDLGETLITYANIPLSWKEHYGMALTKSFKSVGIRASKSVLKAAAERLEQYNTRIFPRTNEIASEKIFEVVVGEWLRGDNQLSIFQTEFFSYFRQSCVAYSETISVLETLKRRGMRVAVLTDVPYGMPRLFVEADLMSAGIAGLVDVLVTSVETGFRKPDSATFRYMVSLLGMGTRDFVYVGNEKKDIEGVNGVGGESVLIDRDGKGEKFGQARTIKNLGELLR